MSIGTVALQLGLIDKEFKSGLKKAEQSFNDSVDSMKKMLLSAALGSYLFSGAEDYLNNRLKSVNSQMSAISEGLTKVQVDNVNKIAESFEYIGVEAEQAQESIYRFILTGKSTQLNNLGIYLSDTTKELLSTMDATERYNWVLENMPEKVDGVKSALGDSTTNMLSLKKAADDLKESLGESFLTVLAGIVNGLGGVQNAMKIALAAFTAYKIATVLGNVAIGISKAIALGSVFSAPIAIAMGLGALATIGTLIGASVIAGNAISNMDTPSAATVDVGNSSNSSDNSIQVVVKNDRWGQTQEVISNRNGGSSNNVQTNFSK